jgi:hypothetical protein
VLPGIPKVEECRVVKGFPISITLVTFLFVACDQQDSAGPYTSKKSLPVARNLRPAKEKEAKRAKFLFIKAQAEGGNATAQTRTAHNFAVGRGVKKDFKEALKWYRRAAAQGDSKAQFNLGYMYYNGEALPRDYPKALEWFGKAAKQGDPGAQGSLGLMYDNGEGVAEDDVAALKWYRLAANQGEPMAQFNVGWMYENGNGVEADHAKALKWYLKAAYGGHGEAPNFIGILYEGGRGVPRDVIAAYAWWLVGVELGDEAPQNNLEFLEKQLTPDQLGAARELAGKLKAQMAADPGKSEAK